MKVKVAQSCPTLCDPKDFTVHGILQARILKWVAFPVSRDLPNPGIKPRPPTLWAGSLPAEPPGKSKNTGVGSLSLLERIFSTQESNWGLLHCRWILYQLSYQGSLTSISQTTVWGTWRKWCAWMPRAMKYPLRLGDQSVVPVQVGEQL